MPHASDADPCNFKCQRSWHAPGLWTWRPSCLPARITMHLAFRKVAAAFGHATFNNDAALVRDFGKARQTEIAPAAAIPATM